MTTRRNSVVLAICFGGGVKRVVNAAIIGMPIATLQDSRRTDGMASRPGNVRSRDGRLDGGCLEGFPTRGEALAMLLRRREPPAFMGPMR
jgi:hypothetical protein